MSEKEPYGPYVYQPYGFATQQHHAKVGRLYGVGGIDCRGFAIVKGLTKREAEVVCEALRKLKVMQP